jgi:hypothetical protein
MNQSIRTSGIVWTSLFKLFFFSGLFSVGLLVVLLGILAGFDVPGVTFTFNDEVVTGFKAFLMSLAFAPIISLIFAFLFSILFGFGQWVMSKFMAIELWYKS